MNKYTNPFQTLKEATNVLKVLGVDPFDMESKGPWQEHILSINLHADYENYKRYYECYVHMDNEGFDALMETLDHKYNVLIKPFVEEFDEYSIEPSEHLRIFKLVDRHKITFAEGVS